jgi:hypothetical protein
MYRYENLTSDDRKNVIERETKDVDYYKENIKGKGSYYHHGQWIASGLKQNELKRNSDWAKILEEGYTEKLGPEKGAYKFKENFNYAPTLADLNDARDEADKIYNPGVAGSESVKNFTERFVAEKVGNLYGSIETEFGNLTNRNFGQRLEGKDKEGKDVYTDIGVSAAHNQAVSRALSQVFDPTDRLTSGYLQGFTQQKLNGLNDYYDKKGKFDYKSFVNDFSVYMQEDLIDHYNKRKNLVSEVTDKQRFKEGSSDAYAGLKEQEQFNLMSAAQKQNTGVSFDEYSNLGIPLYDFTDNKDDYEKYKKDYDFTLGLGDTGNAPFILNPGESGQDATVSINPNFDKSLLSKDKDNVYWKKAFDYWKSIHPNKSDSEITTLANNQIDNILSRYDKTRQKIESGKGVPGVTRNDYTTAYIPTTSISDVWWNSLHNDQLLGQTAENFGHGSFGQVGSSYIPVAKLKGLTYGGVEGEIMFQPNQMPENLETIYVEYSPFDIMKVSPTTKRYNWNSPEWKNMPPSEKNKILEEAKKQESQNPYYGTKFRDIQGNQSNAVEHSNSKAEKMDKYTAELMAIYVSNRNQTNNAIHASPGAVVQNAKYFGKDKQTIIKTLEDIEINVEVPRNYGSNTQYKKIYDDTFKYSSVANNVINQRSSGIINPKIGVGLRNIAPVTQTKEDIIKLFDIPKNQQDKFWENWQSMPKEIPSYKVKDLVVAAKTGGGTFQNWNWNTTTPILSPIKIASNGKINFEAEKYITVHDYIPAENDKQKNKAYIVIPTNVTGVIARSGNKGAVNFMQNGLNEFEKSNISRVNPSSNNSNFNFLNPQK